MHSRLICKLSVLLDCFFDQSHCMHVLQLWCHAKLKVSCNVQRNPSEWGLFHCLAQAGTLQEYVLQAACLQEVVFFFCKFAEEVFHAHMQHMRITECLPCTYATYAHMQMHLHIQNTCMYDSLVSIEFPYMFRRMFWKSIEIYRTTYRMFNRISIEQFIELYRNL